MERIHRIGLPALIFAVWLLSAWTAVSISQPVMYGPEVSISAQAVRHGAPGHGQASRDTR